MGVAFTCVAHIVVVLTSSIMPGQGGQGSFRRSDGVTRVVWARKVASSPWGQHRTRNKNKRAAKNALHTLIN